MAPWEQMQPKELAEFLRKTTIELRGDTGPLTWRMHTVHFPTRHRVQVVVPKHVYGARETRYQASFWAQTRLAKRTWDALPPEARVPYELKTARHRARSRFHCPWNAFLSEWWKDRRRRRYYAIPDGLVGRDMIFWGEYVQVGRSYAGGDAEIRPNWAPWR